VVSDSKKNPVHGLQKSDFVLTENGKPQVIRNFEEHTALPLSETSKIVAAPKLPAGLFTNKSPAPANGPVNVLLLDYLNTPLSAQPYARKQLMSYLDKAPAGTRIAIFGLTTHLVLLQGFTSDMSVLKAALASKKGTPQVSDIMSDAVNGGPQGDNTLSNALSQPTAVEGMTTQAMVDEINRFEAQLTTFEQGMTATYTLNAFDELARYLVGIPGRKNVIWFSGGFPLDIEPDVNEADPNDSVLRNDEEIRKTDNLLTRAQVAVYPVDVLGVQTDPGLNYSSQASGAMSGNTIDGNSAGNSAKARMDSMQQSAQQQASMQTFAEDTGGAVFINTNDLTMAVSKAIEQGSNYYTLTYSPTDTTWDSRFRSIKVKVSDSNAKNLSYRNGYFAVDPDDRNKLVAGGSAVAMGHPSTMSTAMMHGGPDLTQILFKVRIRPASTPPQDEVGKYNQVNPNMEVNGPFQKYLVELVPDARSVSCLQQADDNYHCALEVWSFVYNNKGEKVVTASNRLYNRLTPDEYRRLLTRGMAFHLQISVPVKGEYYIRTAIHDMNSDNVGVVEVAVAQVRRLPPIQIAEAPADAPAAPDASGTAPDTSGTPAVPAPAAPVVPAGSAATP
jgi:VWFA-related protein